MLQVRGQKESRLSIAHPVVLVDILKERGLSEQEIIGADKLLKTNLQQPDGQITYSQYLYLIDKAITLTGDQTIGLSYGERLNATGHGVLGLGIMASDNLLHALEFGKMAAAVLNPSIGYDISESQDYLTVTVKELISWSGHDRFMVDTSFSMISYMLRQAGGKYAEGIKYSLTYSDLGNNPAYKKAFSGPVLFNGKSNTMSIPIEIATKPSPLRNPVVTKQASELLKRELSSIQSSRDGIIIPIQHMISDNPGLIPTLEQIAEKFHVSSRTLNRRLKDLDTSYMDILTETRKKMALEYLENAKYSIDQISHFLGYKDASNFSKAFRVWTGSSPTQFREQHIGNYNAPGNA